MQMTAVIFIDAWDVSSFCSYFDIYQFPISIRPLLATRPFFPLQVFMVASKGVTAACFAPYHIKGRTFRPLSIVQVAADVGPRAAARQASSLIKRKNV
jgi:hypothetical protein